MPQILYLAHDINDAAVTKRTKMLTDGGAAVTLAGFRRGAPIGELYGSPVYDLGQSYNARLGQRIVAILKTCLQYRRYKNLFKNADLILARNLEMLCIARVIRSLLCLKTPIIYELLDIHTLLVQQSIKGKIIRAVERRCLKQTKAVLTSSPGFIDHHLKSYPALKDHILLVENKLYPAPSRTPHPAFQKPVSIGWFGMLRCKKSFEILCAAAAKHPQDIKILLAGKPALDQIPDFFETIGKYSNIEYTGPYNTPEDLPKLYANIDLCWAIDFYEDGANSDWLLPNRLYESGFFGVPAIVRTGTQSSLLLKDKKLGIHIKEPILESLEEALARLDTENYNRLASAYDLEPQSSWAFDQKDCKTLVEQLTE